MKQQAQDELKAIIGDLEAADAFMPDKKTVMFDVLERFFDGQMAAKITPIKRKFDELVAAELALCHGANQPTSRITSLAVKFNDVLKNL